jgi:predicted  nucleic acid-binding Zn-ribbon protein
MASTSINIQPIKTGSEQHNRREKELSYVRTDLSPLNESWSTESVSAKLADIKQRYTATTGQQMQSKATPIREGVIVIQESTTMEQLKTFASRCEQDFGIKAFQIHIHRDEGYQNAKEWTPNLHAHIVFDWTTENGKSVKLNPIRMMQMQTILAESLGMERGKTSDKEHLNAVQWKVQKEEERLEKLTEDANKLNTEHNSMIAIVGVLKEELDQYSRLKASKDIAGAFLSKITKKSEISSLKNEIQVLNDDNAKLKQELSDTNIKNQEMNRAGYKLQQDLEQLKARGNNIAEIERKAQYNGELKAVKTINAFLKTKKLPGIDYRNGYVYFLDEPGVNRSKDV